MATTTLTQSFAFSLSGNFAGVLSSGATLPYPTTFTVVNSTAIITAFTIVELEAPWTTSPPNGTDTADSISVVSIVNTSTPADTLQTHTKSKSLFSTHLPTGTKGSARSSATATIALSLTRDRQTSNSHTLTSPLAMGGVTSSASSEAASAPPPMVPSHTSSSSRVSAHHQNSAAIAGGTVGGLMGLLILLYLLLLLRRRRRRPKVAPSAEFMAYAAARRSPTPTPHLALMRDSSVESGSPLRTSCSSHTDPLLEKLREAVLQMRHLQPKEDVGDGLGDEQIEDHRVEA